MTKYVPKQGDIVWLTLDPQAGKEQAKRRPFLVLSPKEYNAKVGLLIGCPITSKIKNYPFEVLLLLDKIKGAVLADQIKSLDWQVRKAKFIAKADQNVVEQTLEYINLLLNSSSNTNERVI